MNIFQSFRPTFVLSNVCRTISRFPFVVFCCLLTFVFIEVSLEFKDSLQDLGVAIMVSSMGISVFLSLYLYLEKLQRPKLYGPAIFSMTLALILINWLNLATVEASYFRLTQLLVAGHLMVAIAPYLRSGKSDNFWYYNETLFTRFCLSALYASVLLIGLFIMLFSLKGLFSIEVPQSAYRHIALFCVFIFHPLHFLNDVPGDFDQLSERKAYPRALKVFCQYLLVPLVILYGLILVTYGLKITVQQDWPKGILSYLVSGYGVVGLFTVLMISPLTQSEESRWTKNFSIFFSLSLVPLSILMLAAAYRRYSEYGLTESRYFVIVFSLWLLGVGFYLGFSKLKDIRYLPMSLVLISLVTSFGPWGAYSLSFQNQVTHLKEILNRNKVLVNERVINEHAALSVGEETVVTSIMTYLSRRHGLRSLESWFPDPPLDFSMVTLMDRMNIKPRYNRNQISRSFQAIPFSELPVGNYKKIHLVSSNGVKTRTTVWSLSRFDKSVRLEKQDKVIFEMPMDEFMKTLGFDEVPSSKEALPIRVHPYVIHFTKLAGSYNDDDQSYNLYQLEAIVLEE